VKTGIGDRKRKGEQNVRGIGPAAEARLFVKAQESELLESVRKEMSVNNDKLVSSVLPMRNYTYELKLKLSKSHPPLKFDGLLIANPGSGAGLGASWRFGRATAHDCAIFALFSLS
jgi:hypothetical protein